MLSFVQISVFLNTIRLNNIIDESNLSKFKCGDVLVDSVINMKPFYKQLSYFGRQIDSILDDCVEHFVETP